MWAFQVQLRQSLLGRRRVMCMFGLAASSRFSISFLRTPSGPKWTLPTPLFRWPMRPRPSVSSQTPSWPIKTTLCYPIGPKNSSNADPTGQGFRLLPLSFNERVRTLLVRQKIISRKFGKIFENWGEILGKSEKVILTKWEGAPFTHITPITP